LIDTRSPILQCAYLSLQQHEKNVQLEPNNVFGTICFTQSPSPTVAATVSPFAHVPMPALNADASPGSTCELWRTNSDCTYGQSQSLRYAYSDEMLFGVIQLAEEDFISASLTAPGKTPLQLASESAYQAIFELIDRLQFPYILRFWNYITDINGESHGLERYRQFNIGRQEGFLKKGREITGSAVPAASAVGFDAGPLTIYFFASRNAAPTAIENPRQISAYQYPAEYGPRSPTFSRASFTRLGGHGVLFISGTASIVGHLTLHKDDAVAQTQETIANIAAIVEEVRRLASDADFSLRDLSYKAYVRHPVDVPVIYAELRRIVGPSISVLFLKADICRQDLLVEIEASAGHPLEFVS
jgi:chorismate lyase/3-hydroxybenzoate synthase